MKISPNFGESFAMGYLISGDLMDEENVLDFLTSLEAMDLPDRIEEVNSRILDKIVQETDFVAVLFCKCLFQYSQRIDNIHDTIFVLTLSERKSCIIST